MQTVFIGTTPKLLASANANRRRFVLEYTPSSILAANTGFIYVGRGFIPNAVKGDPNQGDVMNAGAVIDEEKTFDGSTLPFKGAIWAVSDTGITDVGTGATPGMQCTFDEEAGTIS